MSEKNGTTAGAFAFAPEMAAAALAANPVVARAWMDIMSEGARLLTDRLEQDLEAQKAMMACRDPGELMRLQSEFFTTAFGQYAAETMRLAGMMGQAAGAVMEDARSGHSRRFDDIPL